MDKVGEVDKEVIDCCKNFGLQQCRCSAKGQVGAEEDGIQAIGIGRMRQIFGYKKELLLQVGECKAPVSLVADFLTKFVWIWPLAVIWIRLQL